MEYDPEECIIRRELYASGKSRAFINDTPASLVQMKELGEKIDRRAQPAPKLTAEPRRVSNECTRHTGT